MTMYHIDKKAVVQENTRKLPPQSEWVSIQKLLWLQRSGAELQRQLSDYHEHIAPRRRNRSRTPVFSLGWPVQSMPVEPAQDKSTKGHEQVAEKRGTQKVVVEDMYPLQVRLVFEAGYPRER